MGNDSNKQSSAPVSRYHAGMMKKRSKSHPLNGTSMRSPTRSRAERARGLALTSSSLAVIGCRVTGAHTASDLP